MRKALLSLVCFFVIAFGEVKAQWVTIQDANFAAFLQQRIPGCMNGNLMDTTCAGVVSTQYLNCDSNQITDLDGIQYFDSLTILYCSFNPLLNIPALPASLNELYCAVGQLTSLPPLAHTNLIILNCAGNLITSIPALPSTLLELHAPNNQLTSLPAVVPSGLQRFVVNFNSLTTFPILPDSLGEVQASFNNLISIPNLPPVLNRLWIDHNPNLSCLPPIRECYDCYLDETNIQCLPNHMPNSSISLLYPVCGLFNNPNGCALGGNIRGNLYRDDNNDCVMQSGESIQFPLKVNLYQSGSPIQSGYFSGSYSFDAPPGNYTISLDTSNVPFEVVCPSSGEALISLTPQDSTIHGVDFGVECKSGFDLAAWSIVGNTFRPAWDGRINIKAGDFSTDYSMHCASGTSGNVSISISGPAKYISPANGALTPSSVNGNMLTYNISDFGTVNSLSDFNIIVRPDTLAQDGEQICITVSVTPTAGDNNPANNVLTQCFTVRTSYDPNDKAVYPDGDILQEQDWLTYTIRFQNTGNDTAIHIQIIDTLNANLEIASFKLLAYSHPNITQVLEGGIVKFNFPNIYLPDSNVNEPLSHGYVQYQVKLNDNLPIGTQIHNTANIYFDFNAPVVTNTVLNTISTATGIGQTNRKQEVSVYPNPTTSSLFIQTDFPAQSISVHDMNGRVMVEKNYSSHLDVSGLASGVYFVELRNGSDAIRKRWVKAD